MNKTVRLAFCSVITALSTAVMFMTGIIPLGTYALPALSGVVMLPVVAEFGAGWGMLVYAAVSMLSFFVAADKEAVLCFILFFGYYPALKAVLEKTGRRLVCFVLKFAVFNIMAIAGFFIAVNILVLPSDSFTVFGFYAPWAILVLGNFAFLLYDYALSLLVISYHRKLSGKLKKWIGMK